jgi:kumamolisin
VAVTASGQDAGVTDDARTTIPGTDRPAPLHPRSGPVDPDEQATVTVYLRPGSPPPPDDVRLTREEWAARMAPSPADIDALGKFASAHELTVGPVDPARRAVAVTGRLADLSAAFGTELSTHAAPDGGSYRGRSGPLSVPTEFGGAVEGVFGLDTRPQARTQHRAASSTAVSYSPVEVAEAYGYPATASGAGQTVGLVELGGGYRSTDIDSYFSGLGVTAPAVTAVSVDGGANTPGTASGADGEVMLDIEVVGATAPGVAIAVYFAPNTDQGFIDAVTTAVHDTTNHPSVVSISWGDAESTWTAQAMQQMEAAFSAAATLGVTVTVAAGDGGSTDGQTDGLQHVDFPASAPHALACGGTSLRLAGPATAAAGGAASPTAATGSAPTIVSEVVWNDLSAGDGATGGGISTVFPVPSYQSAAGVPVSANPGGTAGRGVPDVAGDADPETGYNVLVDGSAEVIGGTSAVAPLWAGLVARLNNALGRDVGYLQPQLYPLSASPPSTGAVTNDITSGTNGTYSARPGWDPCTGLGSPRGTQLLDALRAATAPTTGT